MKKMKTRRHTSSGGVIFKAKEDGIQVVLISHYNQKGKLIWCLPKGSVEKGESLQETAMREVREETGVFGRVLEKIGQIQYWFYSKEEETKIFKTVHFYLLEYLKGDEKDHDSEVDEARWVILEDALGMLTHSSERTILEKAARYLTAAYGHKTQVSSAKTENILPNETGDSQTI